MKNKKTTRKVTEFDDVKELASARHSKNVNDAHDETLSFGDRLADKMAEFAGSWTFIITFAAILLVWIGLNSIQVLYKPFDPFPFILLNLVLSCLAAIQAPVIMMSQNRQEEKDRIRGENDYQTNLKAEILIEEILQRLERIEENQNKLMK